MQWVVEEKGGNEGDYSEKIKTEGVSKCMQIQITSGNEGCFEETREARWKLIGSRTVWVTVVMQPLISWFCFDLTSILTEWKVMRENYQHLPQRWAPNSCIKRWRELGRQGTKSVTELWCLLAFHHEMGMINKFFQYILAETKASWSPRRNPAWEQWAQSRASIRQSSTNPLVIESDQYTCSFSCLFVFK